MPDVNDQHQRWQQEAQFFDQRAEQAEAGFQPIDPLTIQRYSRPRRRFDKEFRFRVLGDLTSREVLDIGCGDGSNAVLLAKLGARVTGIDISPKAIQLAARRAEAAGVASRTSFVCSPLETAHLSAASFDIVWADAILHHLIDELDSLIPRFLQWTRPGGVLLFAEPVNFSPALRRLRFMVPVHTDATPDERPLEPREIQILRRHIPDLRLEPFTMLGRLNRFILTSYNYERSSAPRRALSDLLALTDYAVLRIPGPSRFAGTAVMWGHKS